MTDDTTTTPQPLDAAGNPIPTPTSPGVTAPTPNLVAALPISHKETFWEKAKEDVEEAIKWLRAELHKI